MNFIPLTQVNKVTGKDSIYGYMRLTERDIAMLRWIGEQFAVSFDHLPTLEHLITDKVPEDLVLKYKGVHALTSRWVHYGLIERKKIFAGEPMWVWLTPKGINVVGLDLPSRKPSISRLHHIHAVNQVRLHVEQRMAGTDFQWVCEREANALRKHQGKHHQVDGEIEYSDGYRVAVEVELTQKRKVRLRAILRELRRDYDSVWYFVSDACQTVVENMIREIPDYEETFVINKLSSLKERA